MSFVPLAEAARYVTREERYQDALDELERFYSEHRECAEETLYEDRGFYGIDSVDCEFLRTQYLVWKALEDEQKQSEVRAKQSEIREKQRAVGRQTKNLKRGKTKAAPGSGEKSLKSRRKNA